MRCADWLKRRNQTTFVSIQANRRYIHFKSSVRGKRFEFPSKPVYLIPVTPIVPFEPKQSYFQSWNFPGRLAHVLKRVFFI